MRRTDRSYNPIAKGRTPWLRALWLFFTIGLLSTLGFAAIGFASRMEFTSKHRFSGTLSPVSSPATVSLPANAVLKELLIGRGEKVVAGQTIAVLDVVEMQSQVSVLEAQLLKNNTLLNCLNGGKAQVKSRPNIALPDHLSDAIVEAHKSCEEHRTRATSAEFAVNEIKETHRADQALVAQHIHLSKAAVKRASSDASRQNAVARVLSLTLLQNQLIRRAFAYEQTAEKALAERQRAAHHHREELKIALQSDEDHKQRLIELINAPRLHAPETGLVVRLRKVETGQAVLADTVFAEVRPRHTAGYRATVAVPVPLATDDLLGQTVTIHLTAMAETVPDLTGQITHFSNARGGFVEAEVALSLETTAFLDDPAHGIALRGQSTAASIQVIKQTQNLSTYVTQKLAGFLERHNWKSTTRDIAQSSALPEFRPAPDVIAQALQTDPQRN